MKFIDLFAGCGGLSLGLSWAGWQGLFAVERDPMAFATFQANFLDSRAPWGINAFDWPDDWLPRSPMSIDGLLKDHRADLEALADQRIDLIAGGPPCQGFSFAGRRNARDPRNLLFNRYIDVVKLVKPKAVLLENVPGMAIAHGTASTGLRGRRWDSTGSRYEELADALDEAGYVVEGQLVDASEFGVPQRRTRLIVVGVRKPEQGWSPSSSAASEVFQYLDDTRSEHLARLGLGSQVTAEQAIGDLSILGENRRRWPLKRHFDPEGREVRGEYWELDYDARRSKSAYQRLMRGPEPRTKMDSMRLARHREDVRQRFSEILATCPQGVRMSDEHRATFKLKKHRVYPMHADEPAPTVTTLPDDVLHFRDPRILTVRECARLQSFPDWFVFKGKYTTGGELRTKECPRYTQVGNAVPPLLGYAIGVAMREEVFKRCGQQHAGRPAAELRAA